MGVDHTGRCAPASWLTAALLTTIGCAPTAPTSAPVVRTEVSAEREADHDHVGRDIDRDPLLACRLSFEQTRAAMGGAAGRLDTGDFPPLEMAPEDVFMSDCLALPRMVQKCQVFHYFMEHALECRDARQVHAQQLQQEAEERMRQRLSSATFR